MVGHVNAARKAVSSTKRPCSDGPGGSHEEDPGGHAVSTLVTLEPGGGIRIAAQKQAYEKPSAERIVAALASASSPAVR